METVFYQGYLDSLCGIYSIINADKVVNKSTYAESQELFNNIIESLDIKGILKDIVLEGSDHTVIKQIMSSVAGHRFPILKTNKKGFTKLNDWWSYSKEFMDGGGNRAIILSVGGKAQHLTVVERMTDKVLYLKDSDWGWKTIKKSMCRLQGYLEEDKYIIYPAQCWYLGKE